MKKRLVITGSNGQPVKPMDRRQWLADELCKEFSRLPDRKLYQVLRYARTVKVGKR